MGTPFQGTRAHGNVVFSFTGDHSEQLSAYGSGYYNAARTVMKEVMSKPGYADYDCYPIFYLYRHALELMLKAVLLRSAQLLGLVSDMNIGTKIAYSQHNLVRFLPALNAIFKDRGWLEGEGAVMFGKVCEVVHSVNEIDSKSDVFRYPVRQLAKGEIRPRATTPHHFVLNVIEYSRAMDEVLNLLDGAYTGLSYEWDNATEVWYAVRELLREHESNS